MLDQQKRCTTCRKTFYTTNLFDSTCPDCKRIAAANQQKHDNQKKLQDNQQRHERQLKEEELKHQKRFHEESRRFESEQFKKQQQLEEYKIHQHRQLQEEHLTQTEITSIKDKVYNLALSPTVDTESISRLIKLLLQQHENHAEFIYKNTIALGSPFDTSIKKILCGQLKENISNSYSDTHLSFQQKACKYFMPNFSGYEFDIFVEFLLIFNEFKLAVNDEIKLAVINSEKDKNYKLRTTAELNQSVNTFNYAIENDTSNYKSRKKYISILKTWFGESNTLFPRLNWYLILGYAALYYFYNFKLSLYPLLILFGSGYIISYAILYNIRQMENFNSDIKRTIKENEKKLSEIIHELEICNKYLKIKEDGNVTFIKNLNEYLHRI